MNDTPSLLLMTGNSQYHPWHHGMKILLCDSWQRGGSAIHQIKTGKKNLNHDRASSWSWHDEAYLWVITEKTDPDTRVTGHRRSSLNIYNQLYLEKGFLSSLLETFVGNTSLCVINLIFFVNFKWSTATTNSFLYYRTSMSQTQTLWYLYVYNKCTDI